MTAPIRAARSVEHSQGLLALAGTGAGLWGDDSGEYLRKLRDEWH